MKGKSLWLLGPPGLSIPAGQARVSLDWDTCRRCPWPRDLSVLRAVGTAPLEKNAVVARGQDAELHGHMPGRQVGRS